MDNWFIKIHRQILDWEWYDDINTCRLFLHLLLKANYEDSKWHWIEIKRGQRLTSLANLAKETWLTIQQIRTSITKLKSTQEITHETTSTFSLINLINYDKYQTQQHTKQQVINKRATTNKEREEEKEIKEELKTFSELWKENKSMMSSYLTYVFLDLWFIPSKEETVESFKLWFKEKILDNYKIDNTAQIKNIIDNFHCYWKEQEKKPKNYKTTFMRNPLLNNLK